MLNGYYMPTPMTIEMENEMTKDENQNALDAIDKFIRSRNATIDFLPDKTNENLSEWLSHFVHNVNYRLSFNDWMKLEEVRAVLESALDTVRKDETVKTSDEQVDPLNVSTPQVKAETVDLDVNHKLREQIGLAIGEASICWSEIPTGTFHSERATEIVDRLFNYITRKTK